jgi:hypothetical protein
LGSPDVFTGLLLWWAGRIQKGKSMGDVQHEISKLIFTCDQRFDDGDFDGMGELFAHATIGVKGMGEVVCTGAQETAAHD